MDVRELKESCIVRHCESNTDDKCTKSEEEYLESKCLFLNWLTKSDKIAKEIEC